MENTLALCWEVLAAAGGKADGGGWIIWLKLVILIVVGSIVGCVIYVAKERAKKRTSQLQKIADGLRLPFFPKGDDSLRGQLDQFHLFSQGHAKKISNMLHGENQSAELAIFDYRYTVGHGKDSHTYSQTVIYFRSPTLDLPQFAVRPEGLFHKIGGALGYQDIDFETHPQFSQMYLLRGDDEPRVRELFGDERLVFFESQPKISVEGGGDQLVFYRQKKQTKPDEVRQFIEEGFRVFALFGGSAKA